MKARKLDHFKYAALVVGVLLGRAAQADTVLTFDGMGTNVQVPDTFGDNASSSSTGISVTSGGTPSIDLSWVGSAGVNGGECRWDFYNGGPWSAAQLNDALQGNAYEIL